MCYRGTTTDGWKDWKVRKDEFGITEGTLGITGFESLKFKKRGKDSLCQNIIMSREIRYSRNQKSNCEHFLTYQVLNVLKNILN